MSSEKYILSEKGKPFTIRAAAQIRAEIITEETGIGYRVKEIDDGFVVIPCKGKEKAIEMRSPIQEMIMVMIFQKWMKYLLWILMNLNSLNHRSLNVKKK